MAATGKGKRMLATILGILALVVIALLVAAAMRPDSFRIQRSTVIKAPPERIAGFIEDFHKWGSWSPWENIDPQMKRTFGGPERGKGSTYAWEGNKNIGSGRMEVLESSPSKVLIKLDFLKPFEAHNTAEFTLVPKGAITEVNWAMYGPSPFLSRLMTMFFSMEKMVGGQFETGLANLKGVAEAPAK